MTEEEAIHTTEEEEVSNKSLALAEKYFKEGKPGRSFAHLLMVLKLKPQLKDQLENFFITVLCSWNKYLVAEERYSDLFACYEEAFQYYEHHILYSSLAVQLYRLNYKNEAIRYFQLAIRVNNEYLPALKNLYNLYNDCVQRWHFRMLNDVKRNDSFRQAISNKIRQGHKSALDIGAGTGLLSIYALLEGAEKIYACDYSDTMIDIANKVVSKNVNPDSIALIPKLSNDITIPEDIPCRCSLVFTETVDAAVFGEGILQTLIHAWENLLTPNNVNNSIHGEVIPQSATLYVVLIQCLKIARMNYLLGYERYQDNIIKMDKIGLCSRKTEPYDTENLRLLNYDCLSDPIEVLTINFNNVDELKEILNGDKFIPDLSVCLKQNGFIDALAVWFDLNLDGINIISSSPNSNNRNCCWDQAVFPLRKAYFFEKDSFLNINIECKNSELSANISNMYDYDQTSIEVPQEIIRYMNCISLQTVFKKAINKFETLHFSVKEVLDLSPFPIMGLLFAKHLSAKVTFINEINEQCINILSENNIESDFNNISWNNYITSMNKYIDKFDVIIINCLLSTGELNEELINHLPKIRQCVKSEGIILPSHINICCKLVYSEQLINESEVTNPLLKSDITLADYINIYKVPYHMDFKMDEIVYKSLSKEFIIGQLDIDILTNFDKNTMFEKEIDINEEGFLNAVLCWFNFDIFGYNFATNSNDSYVNQFAWLLNPSVEVQKSDVVKIRCLYNNSFLTFSCIKYER